MLVTHDMLKKSTPVCIAFNHMPWHYLAVARLDIGGQRKHFIWLTNFKKRFEWDGSFNAQAGEMLRITLEIGIASWNAPPEKVLIYAGFRGFENEKIFEFSPSVLPIFQSGLGEDTTWRVVRVVEGATLEKSCAARHLGFESLTLSQPEKPVLPASLFYSRFPIPKPASIASAEITFELYSRCA